MSKRIGLVVLAALCAMAFSAVAASGASAAGNTAFTCVEGAGTFGSSTCSTSEPGTTWKHESFTGNTQLTLSALGNTQLKTKIGLATVTLTATGVECVGCMAENHEEGGVMNVIGEGGKIKYTGVTISVPSCKVVGETVETEPLKLRTFNEGTALRAEVAPATGTTEAVIHLENNGATCALGTTITVTGHADGTGHSTMANFATGENELLVGTQKAELIGEVALSAGLTGGAMHPVALTGV